MKGRANFGEQACLFEHCLTSIHAVQFGLWNEVRKAL
jgi:hypothetical protein